MASQKITDEVTFDLIREYELRPCLWQKSNKHYKNNFRKIDATEEIADILSLSSNTVKDKLRSLRTIYFQNAQKVKKGKSGSGGGNQPKWKFYNALNFLQSETAESGSIDSLDFIIDDDNDASNSSLMDRERPMSSLSQTSSLSGASTSTMTSTKKRKSDHDDSRNALWSTLMESLRPQNAHEEFGSYVSTSLAQIKDDQLVKSTKCKIQLTLAQALSEFAAKQLNPQPPSAQPSTQQIVIFDKEGRVLQQHETLIMEDPSLDTIE